MINKLELTDDELSVIQTSLQMTLSSFEKYEKDGNKLDLLTQEIKEEMKTLFDKFNKEYF